MITTAGIPPSRFTTAPAIASIADAAFTRAEWFFDLSRTVISAFRFCGRCSVALALTLSWISFTSSGYFFTHSRIVRGVIPYFAAIFVCCIPSTTSARTSRIIWSRIVRGFSGLFIAYSDSATSASTSTPSSAHSRSCCSAETSLAIGPAGSG